MNSLKLSKPNIMNTKIKNMIRKIDHIAMQCKDTSNLTKYIKEELDRCYKLEEDLVNGFTSFKIIIDDDRYVDIIMNVTYFRYINIIHFEPGEGRNDFIKQSIRIFNKILEAGTKYIRYDIGNRIEVLDLLHRINGKFKEINDHRTELYNFIVSSRFMLPEDVHLKTFTQNIFHKLMYRIGDIGRNDVVISIPNESSENLPMDLKVEITVNRIKCSDPQVLNILETINEILNQFFEKRKTYEFSST